MTSFDCWPPVRIASTGSWVPDEVLTNADVVAGALGGGPLATSEEWILEHTGIRERRRVAPGEATSHLAARAARAALHAAGTDADDVDLVIVATTTPDWPQPATASAVHHRLGMRADAGAADVNVVCSGFVYALQMGASMLAASDAWTHVLVVGADCMTRAIDPSDRATAIFFGDGAGAVLLRRELEFADIAAFAAAEAGVDPGAGLDDVDGGVEDARTPGIRSVALLTDHSRHDAIIVPGGGSRDPHPSSRPWFTMDGPAVKAFAVPALAGVVHEAARDAGLLPDDLALLVPHQSNRRILEAAIDELGLPEARLASTVEQFGNTATASIPLTLDVAVGAGRLDDGDLVCLAGYGGGLAAAACVVRWQAG